MRNTPIVMGGIGLAVVIITAVIGPTKIWQAARTALSQSVYASDDASPAKQILPKAVREYLKNHPPVTAENADSPQAAALPAPRCSAPEVLETVKSLAGGKVQGPFVIAGDITVSLDAIRTVSSQPNRLICEARLTNSYDAVVPTHLPQDGPVAPGTSTEMKNHIDRPEEISYKVELTDDGQSYVTIIPSDADIQNEQNARQQEQDLQYERQQTEDRQFEEDRRRYEQQQQRLQSGQ